MSATMKREMFVGLWGLTVVLLFGCDGGNEPLAKGADAEASGDLVQAATQYRAVCASGSSLCPIANRRLEQIKIANAEKALSAGEYKRTKVAVDLALASPDAAVKRAAEAMSKLPDLEKGIVLEDALTSPKPDDALATMESIADGGFAVSPKVKEWVAKNRPRILLDRVKAACTKDGSGSCVELAREITRLHPESPESADASKLVEADYSRVFPLLQKAETLLARQSMLYVVSEKVRWCMWDKTNQAADDMNYDTPSESFRALCESEVSPEPLPKVHDAWEKNLEEIHDPSFTKPLGERLKRAEEKGLYDLEPWPEPAGKK
jgi:hypothetical protein